MPDLQIGLIQKWAQSQSHKFNHCTLMETIYLKGRYGNSRHRVEVEN
ncbi:hypothetical protein V6Z12_D10G255700 [Gossypium hirsutum]